MYAREKLYFSISILLVAFVSRLQPLQLHTVTFVWRILKFHSHHFFITRLKKYKFKNDMITSDGRVPARAAGGPDARREVGDARQHARGPRRRAHRVRLRQTDARVLVLWGDEIGKR